MLAAGNTSTVSVLFEAGTYVDTGGGKDRSPLRRATTTTQRNGDSVQELSRHFVLPKP